MDRLGTKGVGLWHWGGAGELARQRTTSVPQNHSSLRSGSLDMTIFLKIFSSCISCPSWKKTMVLFEPFVSFVDETLNQLFYFGHRQTSNLRNSI